MTDDSDQALTASDIAALAKAARLVPSTDRTEVIAAALEGMMQNFDLLDQVEIGETPPTNSFDPRWRA
ncbi:MAG: hypothetical protein AAF367_11780 [Pseudomonadota bacterium]